ncbi:MAG: hypothetical protein JNL28_04155 [Planctomycetes bacterium]|nr:hypothetical protein [Planctomycetota bacterium]
MKILPVALGALSLLLGAGLVVVFNKPGQKRQAVHQPPPANAAIDFESSSKRVPLIKQPNPRGNDVKMTATSAPNGVDQRWAQWNDDGLAALEAGQHKKAVELFDACHAGVPDEPVFTQNLAEALARLAAFEFSSDASAQRHRAIEHMTRAVELAPLRDDLKRRLEQMKTLLASEQGMWTDESEHFQLSYDGERRDLLGGASVITNALEGAYQQFGELFGFYPVENGRPKIRVVLYRRGEFHDATGMGHWAGGLYDGTVRVPVEDLKSEKGALTRVLRHELTHAFVHAAGGTNVPGWLNEGLAQRLEFDSMAHAQTALESARRELRGVELIPLDAMKGSLSELKDEKKIAQAYRQALTFVAWLEFTYGDRVPYQLVAGHKEGGVAQAFEKAIGVKLSAALDDFAQGL